jgi:hypothetical protein
MKTAMITAAMLVVARAQSMDANVDAAVERAERALDLIEPRGMVEAEQPINLFAMPVQPAGQFSARHILTEGRQVQCDTARFRASLICDRCYSHTSYMWRKSYMGRGSCGSLSACLRVASN